MMDVAVVRTTAPADVRIYRKGIPFQARFSLVCTVNRNSYLKVTPEAVQWVTPDDVTVYAVRSNVSWIVDY